MAIWDDTLKILNDKASVSPACLVSFSGGKDSLVILDMCRRVFKTVVCFHMYFVPGLQCIELEMEKARQRWGVEIIYYPHWTAIRALKNGIYCNEGPDKENIPDLKLHDIYVWAMNETGIRCLATGAKASDSLWRKRFFHATKHWEKDGLFYPIKGWMQRDVLAYLSLRKIPVPDGDSKSASGIDLSAPSIFWLHDKHPDDFKKVCEWFPYAEAVVKRREFYGTQKA